MLCVHVTKPALSYIVKWDQGHEYVSDHGPHRNCRALYVLGAFGRCALSVDFVTLSADCDTIGGPRCHQSNTFSFYFITLEVFFPKVSKVWDILQNTPTVQCDRPIMQIDRLCSTYAPRTNGHNRGTYNGSWMHSNWCHPMLKRKTHLTSRFLLLSWFNGVENLKWYFPNVSCLQATCPHCVCIAVCHSTISERKKLSSVMLEDMKVGRRSEENTYMGRPRAVQALYTCSGQLLQVSCPILKTVTKRQTSRETKQ